MGRITTSDGTEAVRHIRIALKGTPDYSHAATDPAAATGNAAAERAMQDMRMGVGKVPQLGDDQ